MARLGLDLNLALQRLLGANKERAAANRESLEDRKLRKENAAEKAQLAADAPRPGSPTQAQEPRGGTPQLYRAPEPAAQRRRKGVQVYGLSNVSGAAVSGTYEQFSEQFTGYAVRSPSSGVFDTISFPLANTYTIQSTEWQPLFNKELSGSRKIYLGDAYTIGNVIKHLHWYFTQKAHETYAVPTGGVAGVLPTPLEATPPTLPFTLESKVYVDETALPASVTYPWATNGTSITRSDGRYIYHSRLIRTAAPGNAILEGKYIQDSVYDTDNYESWIARTANSLSYVYEYTARAAGSSTIVGVVGYGRTEGWVRPNQPAIPSDPTNYNLNSYYGLYWRFDTQTNTVTFSSSSVGTGVDSTVYDDEKAAVLWLAGMHPSDPVSRLWVGYKQSYGISDYLVVRDFLSKADSALNRWPETLIYNESTGYLTITTTLTGWDVPRIFTKNIGQIAYGFGNIPIIELPSNFSPQLTTEQQMLDLGWRDLGMVPQNGLDPLDQYFAIKR